MKIHLKLVQQDKMNEALERDGLKTLHVNFTKAKRIYIKVESLFSVCMSLFLSLSLGVIFSFKIRCSFMFFLSRSLTMSFIPILFYSILTFFLSYSNERI